MPLTNPPFEQQYQALRPLVGKTPAANLERELSALVEERTGKQLVLANQLWGEFLLADERHPKAIDKFEEALSHTGDPRLRGRLHSWIALCWREMNYPERALASAEESLALLEPFKGQPAVKSVYERMQNLRVRMERKLRPPLLVRSSRRIDRVLGGLALWEM
jgi:hypothetical protein